MVNNILTNSSSAVFLFLISSAYAATGPKEVVQEHSDITTALEVIEPEPPMTMLSEPNRQASPSEAREFETQTKQ